MIAFGLALVRWQLFEHATAPLASADAEQVDRIILHSLDEELSEQFRRHRGWSFLPNDAAQRKRWVSDTLRRLPVAASSAQGSANLGDRLGLLDPQGDYLAGAVPHR